MKTSGGFQPRVAIITGAGRATALAFAQKGIAVAIASLLLYLGTEAPAAMSGSAVDLFG